MNHKQNTSVSYLIQNFIQSLNKKYKIFIIYTFETQFNTCSQLRLLKEVEMLSSYFLLAAKFLMGAREHLRCRLASRSVERKSNSETFPALPTWIRFQITNPTAEAFSENFYTSAPLPQQLKIATSNPRVQAEKLLLHTFCETAIGKDRCLIYGGPKTYQLGNLNLSVEKHLKGIW